MLKKCCKSCQCCICSIIGSVVKRRNTLLEVVPPHNPFFSEKWLLDPAERVLEAFMSRVKLPFRGVCKGEMGEEDAFPLPIPLQ